MTDTNDFPPIHLYNTLSRKKEKFEPINKGLVTFYSCGQTVYEDMHVGNAKTFLIWDLLSRVLRYFGYNLKHVQNFTDVGHLTDDNDLGEDKIEKRARMLNEHPMELIDRKINEYYADLDRINFLRPDLAPRATAHITEMIDLILQLIEKGHAYVRNGCVYFDISTFPTYSDFAKLDLKNLKAGARIDVIEDKKNPSDFALWIKAPPGHIMQYTSPWSKGYPGWHLECSTMAIKYLGETIDIHAGGIDHIPVHHTNEIAQSEGATGKKFSNYWLHSEFITQDGVKMSKSKGNFTAIRDLIDELGASPTRFTLLQAHYRTKGDFSMKQAKSSRKRYFRLVRSYHLGVQHLIRKNHQVQYEEFNQSTQILEKFNKSLADDLNTPQAFVQVNTIAKRIDQFRKSDNLNQLAFATTLFETMMNVVGIIIPAIDEREIDDLDMMLKLRQNLRSEGKVMEADAVRQFLVNRKYVIQDTDDQTQWYREE